MRNDLYNNSLHYKFYYDYDMQSYLTAKKEANAHGWNIFWASEYDGVNGDTYIIYDDVSNLPEYLQVVAKRAEINKQRIAEVLTKTKIQ